MRFLLNENMSGTVIRALRERGHDVLSAKESLQGLPDEDVLAGAQRERRLVVTQDKDFTEWVGRFAVVTQHHVRVRALPPPREKT